LLSGQLKSTFCHSLWSSHARHPVPASSRSSMLMRKLGCRFLVLSHLHQWMRTNCVNSHYRTHRVQNFSNILCPVATEITCKNCRYRPFWEALNNPEPYASAIALGISASARTTFARFSWVSACISCSMATASARRCSAFARATRISASA
jgi:hypothetical protein